VGYSYVINQNGKLAHSGVLGNWIQGRQNSPADLNSPVYLASVNKSIAAVALLIAMRESGNGVVNMINQPIGPYLPQVLGASAQVRNLRFRDLLTHRSGFSQNMDPSLGNMKVLVNTNAVARNSAYTYSNVNFILLKYALFGLKGQVINGLLEQDQEDQVNNYYQGYLSSRIFDKIGITSETVQSQAVQYYQVGDPIATQGWNIGNTKSRLGSGGFYMSALDLARFQAFLNNSQSLLNPVERTFMYTNFLGWSDGNDPLVNPLTGDHGTYYVKQGSFQNNAGQGVRTLIITFPKNKVEVVFLANARGGNLDNTNGLNLVLRNAYDNAWN
jgi:CubicO group peptidase (beta-lactamase class C family)